MNLFSGKFTKNSLPSTDKARNIGIVEMNNIDGYVYPTRMKIASFVLLASIVVAILSFYGTDHFFENQYDDAYITYRYAINLAQGFGMVFNICERTDAASSFSYTVILALLYKVGFTNLELVGGCIGLLSLAAIVWLVYKIAIAIAADEYLALFLAFACGFNGFLSGWALSGMETLFWTAIILASVYLMVIDSRPAFIFLAVTLAVFTRFEGVILISALVLHLYNRKSTYKDWLAVFIIVAVLSTFYVIKYEYYGVWISHAYWMKNITPYYQPNPLELIKLWVIFGSVPLLLGFIGLLQNRKYSSILAFTLLSSLSVLFGPTSDWARYSVHLLPILYAFSALGYQFLIVKLLNIKSWKSNSIRLIVSVIFVFIMMLQASIGIAFNRKNMVGLSGHQVCRKQLGSYIETFIPRDEIIALGDIGAIAYMAINHRFVDLYGLTSSDVLSEIEKGNTVDSILIKKDVIYWANTIRPNAAFIGDVEFSCSAGGYLFNLVNIK